MKLSSRKIDPKIIEKYEFTIGNVQGVMVDPNTCEPFLAIQIQVTNKHRSTTCCRRLEHLLAFDLSAEALRPGRCW
jgi:hypothetical protein